MSKPQRFQFSALVRLEHPVLPDDSEDIIRDLMRFCPSSSDDYRDGYEAGLRGALNALYTPGGSGE